MTTGLELRSKITAGGKLELSRSATRVSTKGAPVRFSASQGRIDQVDQRLVPITSSMVAFPCSKDGYWRRPLSGL